MARAGTNHKGGRPKGKLNKSTLLKQRAQALVDKRILEMADKIVKSHSIAAFGTHRVVVVEKDDEGKPHITTVRDMKRIDKLLATGEYGKDYMILAGAEPDWRAGNALLDRALGKPKETIDANVNGDFSLLTLGREADEAEAKDE